MTDRILLTGMAFFGRHGVLPAEQTLGARFVVDVEAALDLRPAGEADDLAATVDYGAIYAQVRGVVEGPPLRLIEAVAERIAAALLAEFAAIERVTVRVHKPCAPIAAATTGSPAVEITRERRPPAPPHAPARPARSRPDPPALPRLEPPGPYGPPPPAPRGPRRPAGGSS